jgi:hypothetical protein
MKPSNTNTQPVEREIDAGNAAASTSEQAADLQALQAAAAEGQPGTVAQAAPEPTGPDLASEIAGLVSVAVATLSPVFPSLKTIYTKETTAAAAAAVAGVCNKHGWLQNGLMGKWGEEIACLAIVGPLAYQTAQGIRADLAARAPAKPPERLGGPELKAKPAEAPQAPKTVQFGAAVLPVEVQA